MRVSRQTLYRWKEKGALALEAALEIRQSPPKRTMQAQEQVLTLLIEACASYRAIQACLLKVCGIRLSLGSISRIVQEAGHRAQQWLSQQQASTPCALALDEQYSSQRGKASLNVIAVHSGQVWATLPPVAVDGESWTLVWWYLSEQDSSVSAVSVMEGELFKTHSARESRLDSRKLDVWHVLHVANVAEHEKCLRQASYGASAIGYLSQELRSLLEVVVLRQAGVLSSSERKLELETVLAPLQRTGTPQSATDWLLAWGYSRQAA